MENRRMPANPTATLALDPKSPRLPVKTVAKRLGVSFQTLYRWAQRGIRGHRLPLFRVGGRSFVLENELDEFLRNINATERRAGQPLASVKSTRRGRQIAEAEAACRRRGI